ncbi:MAG: hypothetical protein AVO34_01585 [Firmicutes bacterium ML8_F2]|jgi:hypothetical protein|nr:MAG: hypothetical protein AVO34_01585 [Firmicutes bacterium ML8_F2]
MNKKILIITALAVVGLGIGTIVGLEQIKHTKTAIADETAQNQAVGQKTTPEQALAEYSQIRTTEQRNKAVAKIKALFGEGLTPTFKEVKARYYSYGIPDPATITDFTQLKIIEVYEDNKGFTTEVDIANNEILSRTKSCVEEMQRVTNDQAKDIAENLLKKITSDSANYELEIENKNPQVYSSIWKKQYQGEFYSVISSGKGQDLARMEERTIAICLRNGELMSYEYKPALTETELTEMGKQWQETQRKDIEALRKLLNTPDKQFIFVNYMSCSECGKNKTANSFRVYRDENGYCYDIDPNGNITADTEMLGQCKTPKL